jgi:hypothetical protein
MVVCLLEQRLDLRRVKAELEKLSRRASLVMPYSTSARGPPLIIEYVDEA